MPPELPGSGGEDRPDAQRDGDYREAAGRTTCGVDDDGADQGRALRGGEVLSHPAEMTMADRGGTPMGAELNPAQRLHGLGQSLWLDSINRVMLRSGALARYVRDLAVTGLTSNPTILGHATAAGSGYDRSLARPPG